MLDGIGQFADTIIGAAAGVFQSREQRRLEEARQATATTASIALAADNLARFRIVALAVFGLGGLWFLSRRMRG